MKPFHTLTPHTTDPYFYYPVIYLKISRDFSAVKSYFVLTFPYTIVRLTWPAHLNLRDFTALIILSVTKVKVSQYECMKTQNWGKGCANS